MKKSKKLTKEIIKKYVDAFVASYIPGVEGSRDGIPTKETFHFLLEQQLGIKAATIRKWKQLEDPRFEPIESAYTFIKSRVSEEWVNGKDKVKSEQASSYFRTVFNATNTEREEGKAISQPITLVLEGDNPFTPKNDK